MSLRVVTPLGAEVAREGDAWVLEERGEYRVVAGHADRADFGGATLVRDSVGFVLQMSFWTGRAAVRVHQGDASAEVALVVQAAAHKLAADEWESLLDEIDRRWPGCSLGVEGGLHGHAGDEGVNRLLALLAFEPLLPAVLADLAALLDALRTREVFTARRLPLRAVRRIDASTARWIASNPHAAAAVTPNAPQPIDVDDVAVSHRRREVSWDHPANRAVRWLLERLGGRLMLVAELLRAHGARLTGSLTDASVWCATRADRLALAADRLGRMVRGSALQHVTPAPPDAAALLTLMNDPLYARVYRRCRRWLAPSFALGEGADVPIRTSFELYERWCLLALRRALDELLPDAQWEDKVTTAVDAFTPPTEGVAAVGRSEAGTVTLYDNLTFRAWPVRSGRFSVSTERRPDFVVTWAGRDGARRWVVLDSKYRASYESLAEAMASMHVYRDALRWPEFSGACRAAVVLAPRVASGAARWSDDAFVDRFGVGVLALRPKSSTERLVAWLRAQLLGSPDAAPAPDP